MYPSVVSQYTCICLCVSVHKYSSCVSVHMYLFEVSQYICTCLWSPRTSVPVYGLSVHMHPSVVSEYRCTCLWHLLPVTTPDLPHFFLARLFLYSQILNTHSANHSVPPIVPIRVAINHGSPTKFWARFPLPAPPTHR